MWMFGDASSPVDEGRFSSRMPDEVAQVWEDGSFTFLTRMSEDVIAEFASALEAPGHSQENGGSFYGDSAPDDLASLVQGALASGPVGLRVPQMALQPGVRVMRDRTVHSETSLQPGQMLRKSWFGRRSGIGQDRPPQGSSHMSKSQPEPRGTAPPELSPPRHERLLA